MKVYAKDVNILNYDICVYSNHNVVYSCNKKFKPFMKSLYNNYFVEKLLLCIALMKLNQDKKISLDNEAAKYLPNDCPNISIKKFMHSFLYANLENDIYNFANIQKIIEICSDKSSTDYIFEKIIRPLKIKSALPSSQKNSLIIATVADYAFFLDILFADTPSKNICKILSNQSLSILFDDIIFKNKPVSDKIISITNNNSFIIIDVPKKIIILLSQHTKNTPKEQPETYEKIKKLVYDGSGVNSFSKAFNLFP